ncbi:MAG: peptidoglycan glycosyltransferase FtsI [Ruminobacter sp.]|uniref:Cell division protein FtsI (Penicillin-binding protein 3) n=1 Tax=Ruminobacter amylophilus TaxID=867 RepID=A0A662ZIH3_9GAMM|nr:MULTISPECIES: penicillin-binding transpeptidase domain-containing protein [Ruminobacter]MBQ3774638.1 peptidoglycan glycosyltransferase FtsI [Ruminobacter sp.]SFP35064.1 cell division protein FtsI (penicillin-binding protein 3) [Ruminobacter amylophilus]
MKSELKQKLKKYLKGEGDMSLNISSKRVYFLWGFFFFLIICICLRIYYLMVYSPDWLISKGDDLIVRTQQDDVHRGRILDRNGVELASSVPKHSISLYRRSFHESKKPKKELDEQLKVLATLVGMPYQTLHDKVYASNKGEILLAKEVESFVAAQIKEMGIPGVSQSKILHRYYPTAEVNAQLVGITNVDGIGTEGIEKQYNDYLLSIPGQRRIKKDNKNNIIEYIGTYKEEKKAEDLYLSIDERIQFKAYTALKYAVEINQATSGSLVLIDAWTGEILAMVNSPSYNPNNRDNYESRRARNRAVTDSYEPGSTTKPLIAMGALAHNRIDWRRVIDCRPFLVNGKRITDSHAMNSGTLSEVIKFSSNTAMAHVALEMKASEIISTLSIFGYGKKTNLNLVGESAGSLPKITNKTRISDIERATMGYGYRLRATPLQIAQAYSIFANKGIRKPLSIIKVDTPPVGTRVLNEAETKRMLDALESVVEGGGTGSLARVPGYRIGGKTGTAKVAESGGYGKYYMGSFVGIAPMSNPRFAMAVIINEPHAGKFYGGVVAGPVFSEVMQKTLELYNIPPDDLNPDGSMKTIKDKDRILRSKQKKN